MPSFQKTSHVHHSARDMFNLVADIEAYPEFVPLCEALTIRSSKELETGTVLIADMTVAYKFIRETFTSKVVLAAGRSRIDVSYLDGPFHHMENRWDFIAHGERTCEIAFYIDYQLRSRAMQLLMGAAFDRAFQKFSSAFEERADAVYGRSCSAD